MTSFGARDSCLHLRRMKEALQLFVQLYDAANQFEKAAECRRKLAGTNIPAAAKQTGAP